MQDTAHTEPLAPSRASIAAAHRRIASAIRRTPVVDVNVAGHRTPVTLKLELLQHTGSFKPRGAFANLVGTDVPAAGVAAASGGNHGAAVAFAARTLGIPAHIFVPEQTPKPKLARIESYGAEVVLAGERYAAALARCDAFVAQTGALAVHAYDSPATLDGQGTIGLELEDQAPDLDTLLVAVGGGGLIGGIAAWCPLGAKVGGPKDVGVEPTACNALHAALAAGRPADVTPSGYAVDSLGASRVGALVFPIAQAAVDHVALVEDADIARAQGWLWNELRLITEPGGATALAALLSGAYVPAPAERVGIIVCGANTDPAAPAFSIDQPKESP
jgi:threonine dehydratase